MMIKCIDPNVGKLITRYEFGLVSEDEKKLFEAHLQECDACFEDLYSMSHVTQTLKEKPEIIINALKENIDKREMFSIRRVKELVANFVYNISSSISSLLLGHRAVTISIAASSVILLFAVILWRSNFFEKQPPRQTSELTQNRREIIDSSKVVQQGVPPKNLHPKIIPEKETIEIQKETNLKSFAAIEHEHYSALLSQKNDKNLEAKERLFYDGIKYYEEKNYQQAIVALSQLDETIPNYTEAQFYLGMCYLLLKDTNRGIKYLQSATGSNNNIIKEKSHWYLGNAYLLKNDAERALHEFQIVVQLNGEYKNKVGQVIKEIKSK